MSQSIIILPGDGIGPEVLKGAVEILRECAHRFQVDVSLQEFPVGGQALEQHGQPLPEFVLEACQEAGIVLLGAVGDPRYDKEPHHRRPERALLGLRKALGLFANLRPVRAHSALIHASTLKPEVIREVDLLIVRELTGGIYFGEPRGLETRSEGRVGFNSEIYFDYEIERIARVAFESSEKRRRRVTSVDKSNVLESSQLWREVVEEVAEDFPEVELEHILIDNCAMQLVARPGSFDVLLANNMFGDILSDEAAMLTGSIGMLPSASLGEKVQGTRAGLYEPVHGSAPDIAGTGKANPLAAIASVALLFRYSLEEPRAAERIESAIEAVLEAGYRTPDIASKDTRLVTTSELVDLILQNL